MSLLAGSKPFRAMVLAGGAGSRLHPLTASLPKPLLPIGECTVIGLIIRRLASAGVDRVTVAVNYLADLIEDYLGSGERFGVPIDYVREQSPLGTAGAIGLIAPWRGPLLVTNSDVLSDLDIENLLLCHCQSGAALTVSSLTQSLQIEAGVLTIDHSCWVTSFVEKPVIEHRVNMGTYVLDPNVGRHIVPHERLEMPDLMLKLLSAGQGVLAFDHKGVWLDIGRPNDLAKAQSQASRWSELSGINPAQKPSTPEGNPKRG